jgi:hypothetical protein
MMRSRTRRRQRGQAVVELALVIPLLVLLMLGAADLARAFYLSIEITGASRAGMRNGVLDTVTDIGAATRAEPNSAILNDVPTWGDTGPGGLNADCSSASQKCGDPTGCPPAVFTGTRIACFAIRTCTLTSGICPPDGSGYGAWGSRPAQSSGQGLAVRAVYKLVPATPMIAQFAAAANNNIFYLTADTIGLELY